MDISVIANAPNTNAYGSVRPQASAPAAPPKAVQDSAPAELPSVAVTASDELDKARFEQMQRASETLRNAFVVSDMRFTIFKDRSGEFVTRFTNLRDGSVTYYPERYMHEFYADFTGASDAVVTKQA